MQKASTGKMSLEEMRLALQSVADKIDDYQSIS